MNEMDAVDRAIVRLLQEELPLVLNPYGVLAEQAGVSETEFLERMNALRASGRLRRVGAILHHRKSGYGANALVVWRVPEERMDAVGKAVAEFPQVTHCYFRESSDADWKYNLYSMVHSSDTERCREIVEAIAESVGLSEYAMLFSTQELKKTSMKYFASENV